MASTSSDQSTSSSTSVPTSVNSDQSDWSLDFAKYLRDLGDKTYSWAIDQYDKVGSVTDAQVDNYIGLAQKGLDFADKTLGRYNDLYAPQADQYAIDAQQYASPYRISHEMGRAEADAMQAGDKARANAQRDLEAYGIDPSSGRYQDLVQASYTKDAAAAAAAGEQAYQDTEKEGTRRKELAMSYGSTLPKAALEGISSAYTGVKGATDAALGKGNLASSLIKSGTGLYDTASNLKYPPTGQDSKSESSKTGGSSTNSGSGGGSKGGGGSGPGGGGRGGGDGAGGRNNQGAYSSGSKGALNITNPFAKTTSVDDFGGYGGDTTASTIGGVGWDTSGWSDPSGYNVSDVYTDNGYWLPQDNGSGWADWGDLAGSQNYDYSNGGIPYYTGTDNYSGDLSGWGDYSTPDTGSANWGSGSWDNGGGGDTFDWNSNYGGYGDSGGWDTSSYSPSYDTSSWDSGGSSWDSGGYDYSGDTYSDYGSDYGDYGYYAKGGPVNRPGYRGGNRGMPPRQGGGKVPPRMSPSGGRRVDDVPAQINQTGGRAQLNVGEFVLPRDVVQWKGQEFFQKMIEQARKARTGAPAKPSRRPTGGFNHG